MTILSIKNTGAETAEVEIRSETVVSNAYITPSNTLAVEHGRVLVIGAAETGRLTLLITNESDVLSLDFYKIGAGLTARRRRLAPSRSRRVRVDRNDQLLVIPVGLF